MKAKAEINIESDEIKLDLKLSGRQRAMLNAIQGMAAALLMSEEEQEETQPSDGAPGSFPGEGICGTCG